MPARLPPTCHPLARRRSARRAFCIIAEVFFRTLFGLAGLLLSLLMLLTVAVMGAYAWVASDLPSVKAVRNVQLQTPLRVHAQGGEVIAVFGDKRRKPVAYEQVPRRMIEAFLAAEDDRFFEHPGVDYMGLIRAALELIRTGKKTQGGSTITMQLARNFFLTNQRTYERKIKEIFLALRIERLFSKEEILSLYLNKIFLGKRAYGVAAAAEVYYGKDVAELTLAQTAMLAGMPKAPSVANPLTNPDKALERRNYVLKRMRELDKISASEYAAALATGVSATPHNPQVELKAPYVAEMVRKEMLERYGKEAYTGGFTVHTTVDAGLQRHARTSLRKGLLAYSRRHGWIGAEGRVAADVASDPTALTRELNALAVVGGLEPGIVVGVEGQMLHVAVKSGEVVALDGGAWRWARPRLAGGQVGARPENAAAVAAVGDVVRVSGDGQTRRLAQIPEVGGALVALAPDSGAITALAGGFDFYHSKFNRATQARRQPGSSFKPFVYSAALGNGLTPATIIKDTPVVFTDPDNRAWRPQNYSGKFYGPTRLREALQFSRNLVSVKLVDQIGIEQTLDYVRRFGFQRADQPRNLTLALGSGTATPLELARGYAVFANGGFLVKPYLIDKITSLDGIVFAAEPLALCTEGCAIYPYDDAPGSTDEGEDADVNGGTRTAPMETPDAQYAPRAIPSDVAYQMTSMMRDVIRHGTGRRARTLRRDDVAGKTGTTNEQRDAWFSGFNRDLVCTVWVGFDDHKPLGERETGAVAALPTWIDFMRKALADKPERPYYKPPNIVSARIDPENGLLAHPGDENAISETFRMRHLPKKITKPAKEGESSAETEGLF